MRKQQMAGVCDLVHRNCFSKQIRTMSVSDNDDISLCVKVSSCEVHYKITFQNILSPIYHRVEGSFKNKNDKPSEDF